MRDLRVGVLASAVLFATSWTVTLPHSKAAEPEGNNAAPSSTEEMPPVGARPPQAPVRIVYKPSGVGSPASTVGGGSRGSHDRVPVVFAIAPDHVGTTASVQPSLFWYIDRLPDPAVRVEFTLTDASAIEPLVEQPMAAPDRTGLQRIRLSDYGVQLAAGSEYEWSVALVVDPDDRSKDIVATGLIDRVANSEIAARFDERDGVGAAVAYAEEGIFYDAFSALSDQIERDPTNAQLRNQRFDLLRQVGLELETGSDG